MRFGLAVTLGLLGCTASPTTTPAGGSFPVANPAAVTPSPLPSVGPWYHTVRTAISNDGLSFTDQRSEDLVLHGSVPAVLQFPDGTIRVYFVDFSSGTPERLGCVESTDGGKSYRWGGCVITGLQNAKAVDYAPVLLNDGRVRMYFYASGDDVNSTTAHKVDAAISTDGIHFAREGTVFTYDGLVDPDVFFNGSIWIMHVFSLQAGATVVARSSDGLSFQQTGLLEPRNYGVTKPVRLPDGRFRMYAFPQPDASEFVSMISTDGLSWALEAGTRFKVAASTKITDPYVTPLSDGRWIMAYKQEKR
jgi:hypothetical protein